MIWEQTVKYINFLTIHDTTLSKITTPSNSPSNMTDYFSSLLICTADNDMQFNTSQTKEMILGRMVSTSIFLSGPILRVTTFKLLGFHLGASLSCTIHINNIVSKASKWLLSGTTEDSWHPSTATTPFLHDSIRPLLEYASTVWHYSITCTQPHHLRSIRKRAVHIIVSFRGVVTALKPVRAEQVRRPEPPVARSSGILPPPYCRPQHRGFTPKVTHLNFSWTWVGMEKH